ncbi:MAG: hypothetical protein P4L55_19015 [Syntrophobacteraceae bacterium]|nr:hypothetical protein [Syntrophobacteraceae bacterium]
MKVNAPLESPPWGERYRAGQVPIKRIPIVCFFLLLNGLFSPLFAAPPSMVEKNLFSQERKPPLPASESESTQGTGSGVEIENIQLDGVVFRGNSRKALLRLKNGQMAAPGQEGNPLPPVVTVRVGEMVDEYRVTKIDLRSVTLEKSGQAYTIGLFASNKVVAPASPAPSFAASARARAQSRPGINPRLPHGPMFHNGFRPKNPQQALRAPMSRPPGRPPGTN